MRLFTHLSKSVCVVIVQILQGSHVTEVPCVFYGESRSKQKEEGQGRKGDNWLQGSLEKPMLFYIYIKLHIIHEYVFI